jgi:hypothetical protein
MGAIKTVVTERSEAERDGLSSEVQGSKMSMCELKPA